MHQTVVAMPNIRSRSDRRPGATLGEVFQNADGYSLAHPLDAKVSRGSHTKIDMLHECFPGEYHAICMRAGHFSDGMGCGICHGTGPLCYDWNCEICLKLSLLSLAPEFEKRNMRCTENDLIQRQTRLKSNKRLEFACLVCGHEWTPPVFGVVNGLGCIKCRDEMFRTPKIYEDSLAAVIDALETEKSILFVRLEDDRVDRDRLPELICKSSILVGLWRCSLCSREWTTTVQKVAAQGRGCACRGYSKSQEFVTKTLEELCDSVRTEVGIGRYFVDARVEHAGRTFDVEVDGEQHFEDSRLFRRSASDTSDVDVEKMAMSFSEGRLTMRIPTCSIDHAPGREGKLRADLERLLNAANAWERGTSPLICLPEHRELYEIHISKLSSIV